MSALWIADKVIECENQESFLIIHSNLIESRRGIDWFSVPTENPEQSDEAFEKEFEWFPENDIRFEWVSYNGFKFSGSFPNVLCG
jgi:hypothetical protein